ncbi:MAG TPA: alpha/beta fold hydrolase [Ktedonobacterales bacterium]
MSDQSPRSGRADAETLAPPRKSLQTAQVWMRRALASLLIVSGLAMFSYAGVSYYIATKLAYAAPQPLAGNPGEYGLEYAGVSFPAREDGVLIKGWVIPGVLPDGRYTDDRIIIVVHGTQQNRTDPGVGLLALSVALTRHGFAVLAFDMRGTGESQPAALSMGYFEQRDALGAADFIRAGGWPFPELGRPRVIGGFGVSMGGATMLFAASREPAIRAVVSDCAYADVLPILEREIPKRGGVPPLFTPGALLAAHALYGSDYYAVRPVDVIARIAPRPVFLIHGADDTFVPPSNMIQLYARRHQLATRTSRHGLCLGPIMPNPFIRRALNTSSESSRSTPPRLGLTRAKRAD